jgi:radical SAM superfamily enzyme YgiQ (UPF0313 family)
MNTNNEQIPNFTGLIFPKPNKEVLEREEELINKYMKNGGVIKDYGSNFDINKYKEKRWECTLNTGLTKK